jgi:salicylate hydroxylase
MYKDIEEKLAEIRHESYTDNYIKGLPVGLQMSNGVIVGEA